MKSFSPLLVGVLAQQPSFLEWCNEFGVVCDSNGDGEMESNYHATLNRIAELEMDANQQATFKVNQFSGMSWEQFEQSMLTFRGNGLVDASDLPLLAHVDAVAQLGAADWDVTPAKDQGGCGSCWAFGTIGGIEAKHKQLTSTTVLLSEQQLVDCDNSCDGSGSTTCDSHCNCGCQGGQANWAYGSYLKNGVTYTQASYPYKGTGGSCRTGTDSGIRLSGYTSVTPMNDGNLAAALQNGAVVVAIGANGQFQSYSSGILTGVTTSCSLNHQVMVTGYASNYWKVKNSWGRSWGENGFIRFERATSGCGPFGLFVFEAVVPNLVTGVEV